MSDISVEYIAHMGTDLTPVNAARVSMNKESDWVVEKFVNDAGFEDGRYVLSDKDIKLINYLADNQHTSCFEHQTVTLRLKVPIFIARQIHRHRTFAYNEVSRRYVKDELEFYWPETWRKAATNVKQGSSDEAVSFDMDVYDSIMHTHKMMVWAYGDLLNEGVAPEQARMVLPQNLMTTFYMTGNLRAWQNFLRLRLDSHSQKEIRDVAKLCAAIIEPLFPVSYAALMK